MAMSIEEITKELVGLPRHERLALVRLLLDLDQPRSDGEIENEWDTEIRARVKAVDEGRVTGADYQENKHEIAKRLVTR
jgi:hypothetical protein